ncbi:ribosomal subunit interface protein [Kocuria rhizophila]|nr:ribosomal subunit interface protein [Kocuria rhizophila]
MDTTVVGRGNGAAGGRPAATTKFAAFDEAYGKLVEQQLRRARTAGKIHRAGHQKRLWCTRRRARCRFPPPGCSRVRVPAGAVRGGGDEAFDTEYPLSHIPPPWRSAAMLPRPPDHGGPGRGPDGAGGPRLFLSWTGIPRPSAVYRRKGWEYGVISLSQDGRSEQDKVWAYQSETSAADS